MSASNFQSALRLYLLADSAVAALLGTSVYETPSPEAGAIPYSTIHQISSSELNNVYAPDQIVDERFQFDIFTLNFDQAVQIDIAIRNALHFKNHLSVGGYYVWSILRQGRNATHEPVNDASEDVFHRVSVDYTIRRNYNPS
jgi:hypothetical protein